jgi:hypothetical protein
VTIPGGLVGGRPGFPGELYLQATRALRQRLHRLGAPASSTTQRIFSEWHRSHAARFPTVWTMTFIFGQMHEFSHRAADDDDQQPTAFTLTETGTKDGGCPSPTCRC